ncbi:MAG: hypothetical protein AAF211_06905 [Myxococcota bacterium]
MSWQIFPWSPVTFSFINVGTNPLKEWRCDEHAVDDVGKQPGP